MRTITRSAGFDYSSKLLYTIIDSIEEYPEFIDGCSEAKIINRGENYIDGTLKLIKTGLNVSITTRNYSTAYSRIEMRLLKGPLTHLEGVWEFTNSSENASNVVLTLKLASHNLLFSILIERLILNFVDDLISSIQSRAQQLTSKSNL